MGRLAEAQCKIRHAHLCGENWLVRPDQWLNFNYLSLDPGNWKRRTELLEYCTTVVDQALIDKRRTFEVQAEDPTSRRKIQGAVFEDEVKVPSTLYHIDNLPSIYILSEIKCITS